MDQKQELYPAAAPMHPGPPAYTSQPVSQFVAGPAPVNPSSFGPFPMRLTCDTCHANIVTTTQHVPGSLTYILGTVLCLTTCCCCIPFCIDRCQDVEHVCPNCNTKLGLYKRL